jgi:hypothetical protein
LKLYRWLVLFMVVPTAAWASGNAAVAVVTDFTASIYGYLGLLLFILAYTLVTLENKLHLRKSRSDDIIMVIINPLQT